ncbi:unnamed protein product, partial [Oncorhynchus mykiss]
MTLYVISTGQLISDDISEIITRFNRQYYTPYSNQLTTKSASAQYDDSYLGYSVTVGDFNADGEDDYITGVPRGDKALGYVNIFNGRNMQSVLNFTGTQMVGVLHETVRACIPTLSRKDERNVDIINMICFEGSSWNLRYGPHRDRAS